DGRARVWEAADGREVCRSPQHDGAVTTAEFAHDGRRFCTAGADGTVRVCDANTGQELLKLTHPGAVREAMFSPDGRLLLTVADRAARLWDAASGAPAGGQPELRHEGQQVLTAAFDKDGARVATGGADNRGRLWDVASGRQLAVLKHDQ